MLDNPYSQNSTADRGGRKLTITGADQLEHETRILYYVTAFSQTDLFLVQLLFSKLNAVPLQ